MSRRDGSKQERRAAASLEGIRKRGADIVTEAQEILEEEVLPYFGQRDIHLGHVPQVKFIAEPPVAYTNCEATVDRRDLRFDSQIDIELFFLRTLYRKAFKLNVSDGALRELMSAYDTNLQKERKDEKEKIDPGEYIYLFPEVFWGTELKPLLTHEVWHLIESEYDLEPRPFIEEGSATYVECLSTNTSLKWIRRPTIEESFYANAGYLVQEIVGEGTNPLKALLDERKRERIEHEFERRGKKPLEWATIRAIKDGKAVGTEEEYMSELVMYDAFRRLPTRKGFLRSLERAPTLVHQLRRQNLGRLVNYYQRVLRQGTY
jgi:hypothetical protein